MTTFIDESVEQIDVVYLQEPGNDIKQVGGCVLLDKNFGGQQLGDNLGWSLEKPATGTLTLYTR